MLRVMLLVMLALPGLALAQSAPTFSRSGVSTEASTKGQAVSTAADVQSAFTTKVDVTNGRSTGQTLVNSIGNGGTLSNTAISGGTITGAAISGGTITSPAISGGTMTGMGISGGTIASSTTDGGSVTTGAITNTLPTWMSYLAGTINPSSVIFGSTATFGGSLANPITVGGGTGSQISVGGSSNANLLLLGNGTGGVIFRNGSGATLGQFASNGTVVNSIQLWGEPSGTDPAIIAAGVAGAGLRLLTTAGGIVTLGSPEVLTGYLNQSSTTVLSGNSNPAVANTGLFSVVNASGYVNDGGHPALNYFRVTSSTTGNGDFAYRFWEDVSGGVGGRSAVQITAGNDAFGGGYTAPTWVTGTVYAQGQVVAVGYNLMYATSSGTSGVTTPTCTQGVATCSDGVVGWKFLFFTAYSQVLVGATVISNPTLSWGGISGAPIGETYGLNLVATCKADWSVYCIGEELDFGIYPATHSESRVGYQLLTQPGSVAGTVEDVGWRIGSQGSGSAPLANLMTWGSQTSDIIVSTTGYGLQAYSQGGGNGAPAFMGGSGAIDMAEWAPSASGPFGGGFVFRGPGSQILGNGDVQSSYALLHKTAAGASLDAPEYHVTGVAVTGGSSGTGWTCTGKWARGADGSIVLINTISGGAVTGVSLILGAYSSTNTSPITYTAEQPRNCAASTATGSPGVPSTFSVDTTWARANSGAPILTLGGTATLSMGAAEWTANGSVATSMTSLGPTGSHTTIQKWFTVFDSDGTTIRYIPAY